MAQKIIDEISSSIDYRLSHIGIRVWEGRCQLIGRAKDGWRTIGLLRNLPVRIPLGDTHAEVRRDDPLSSTAYCYTTMDRGTDLVDVLGQRKTFSDALNEREK